MRSSGTRRCSPRVLACLLCAGVQVGFGLAQDPNACDEPADAPDLIVGDLDSVIRYDPVADIAAYAIGNTSCNLGSCWVDWFAETAEHPVFGQNLFRLADGRFEQIGQSWVFHRYFALSSTFCDEGCIPTNGQHLGVDCSTTNSPSVTGSQIRLGPKSEVDASNGTFVFPFTGQGVTGDAIFKRLQARNDDLEPGLNPGARYFIEGQNVAADDAAAGNQHNNVSHREVLVAPATLNLVVVGKTRQQQPAIEAWTASDPEVVLEIVDVPGDGRLYVASRATPLAGGVWHYEYAVQNVTSHRSVMSVAVPVPSGATVSGIGFHDVEYHSGEPYDGTDWPGGVESLAGGPAVLWSTEPFDRNPDANALRWGTLYNFRFDVDAPPVSGPLTLGLYRPGGPDALAVTVVVPTVCSVDGVCGSGENACNCADDCGPSPAAELDCGDGLDGDCDGFTDCFDPDCCGGTRCPAADADGDGHPSCVDCDDHEVQFWAVPGEVGNLLVDRDDQDRAILTWDAPVEPGGLSVGFDALRAPGPQDFSTKAVCLVLPDPQAPPAVDPDVPAAGDLFAYLVRAKNGCPAGTGPLGPTSSGSQRSAPPCP